ncbi:MAG: hypothetical protein ACI8XM_000803 [Haloarculaceae archaeon]|jgi:hypothetical protein
MGQHGMGEVPWVVAGNLVIGIGAGTATLFAFRKQLPLVVVGFALFFGGYRLSQAGIYASLPALLTSVRPDLDAGSMSLFILVRAVATVAGVVGLALGMQLFADTITQGPTVSGGLLAGVVCITGYIFGHVGMNGNLL